MKTEPTIAMESEPNERHNQVCEPATVLISEGILVEYEGIEWRHVPSAKVKLDVLDFEPLINWESEFFFTFFHPAPSLARALLVSVVPPSPESVVSTLIPPSSESPVPPLLPPSPESTMSLLVPPSHESLVSRLVPPCTKSVSLLMLPPSLPLLPFHPFFSSSAPPLS